MPEEVETTGNKKVKAVLFSGDELEHLLIRADKKVQIFTKKYGMFEFGVNHEIKHGKKITAEFLPPDTENESNA